MLFSSSLYLKMFIVSSAAVIGVSSWVWFNQPQDNVIEECAECVIEAETGLVIDLSPSNKKKK